MSQDKKKILKLRRGKKKFQNCSFLPLRKGQENNFNEKDTVTHRLLPFILSFIQSGSFKINESYSLFIGDAVLQVELHQMQHLWRV